MKKSEDKKRIFFFSFFFFASFCATNNKKRQISKSNIKTREKEWQIVGRGGNKSTKSLKKWTSFAYCCKNNKKKNNNAKWSGGKANKEKRNKKCWGRTLVLVYKITTSRCINIYAFFLCYMRITGRELHSAKGLKMTLYDSEQKMQLAAQESRELHRRKEKNVNKIFYKK